MEEEVEEYMKKWKEQSKEIAGVLLLGYGFYVLVKLLVFCFSSDIWYDEVFSAGMMRYSLGDITKFTAKDVHPPLYYWYLKSFVSIVREIAGQVDAVILAKMASLLPFVGLWILAATKVRREFGVMTAGVFAFCVLTMPQITGYGIEIRMYSFALFWVTLAFFFAYKIYKDRSRQGFTGLFFCGLITAYTQYFSCLAIVFLYLLLGVAIRKDKQSFRKWLLNIAASVVGYLPWLGILIRQFTKVNESYWIPPLTWRSLAGCVKYIYLPSGGYPAVNYLVAVGMILATAVLSLLFLRKQGKVWKWFQKEGALLFLGYGMLGCLILTGVGVSIFVSPVFVYRYMIPCLGAFWFVYAFLLQKCEKHWIWLPILVLTVYTGYLNVNGVCWEESQKIMQMQETVKGMDQVKEEDILIFNFHQLQATVGYYKDNESYLLYQEAESLIQEIYREYGMVETAEEIKAWRKQGKKVWFLGSFVAREDIVEEWKNSGLKVTEMGSYLLERYWFNLYSVE